MAQRDSRMGPFARSVMAELTDRATVEQVPEVMQKTASGYTPRMVDVGARHPASGTLTTRQVEQVARATGDIVREAREAVVSAYHKAGQNVQTTLLGVETVGSSKHVKFAVKQSMRDKGVEISAVVTPEGVLPVIVRGAAFETMKVEPTRFYIAKTNGQYEEVGAYTNGFEVKTALNRERVFTAEIQPNHYVLGLLPEDERDLRAIAAAAMQIGKLPNAVVKTAQVQANPLQSTLQNLKLSVDALAVRLAEADTELAKTASYDTLATADQRKALYASLTTELADVFDLAVHYANGVTQIHPKLKKADREQLMTNAERQISRWSTRVSELYNKAASIFTTVTPPSVIDKAQAILSKKTGPGLGSFVAQQVEAAEAGLTHSNVTELDVLREIKGFVAALKADIKSHVSEVNPEQYAFEPNFVHTAADKYPLVMFDNGGTLRQDEWDVEWSQNQDAVKDALSGREGKTLDEVAVEKGLDKGTVLRAVKALRSKGFLLVDVVKEGDKAGNHIVEPGHDLLKPSKYVLVQKNEVTLKDGEVEFKKGANLAQLQRNLNKKRAQQIPAAEVTGDKSQATEHPDMIPVLTCRKCGKAIGVQNDKDGSWRAFCPSCKAKEGDDSADKKANAQKGYPELGIPPAAGASLGSRGPSYMDGSKEDDDLWDREDPSNRQECLNCGELVYAEPDFPERCPKCSAPLDDESTPEKTASNHSPEVNIKRATQKCANTQCGYEYLTFLKNCPKCQLKTAGLIGGRRKRSDVVPTSVVSSQPTMGIPSYFDGADGACPQCGMKDCPCMKAGKKCNCKPQKRAQSVAQQEAAKPAPAGKKKIITRSDDGMEQVTVVDENQAEEQLKNAASKRGACSTVSARSLIKRQRR